MADYFKNANNFPVLRQGSYFFVNNANFYIPNLYKSDKKIRNDCNFYVSVL